MIVDQGKVACEWASRGFSCGLFTDPPGQRWEDFVHETDEVVVVVEGEMEFEVEGEVHHPKVGEELFIPAGAPHSARNVGNKSVQWLYGYRHNVVP